MISQGKSRRLLLRIMQIASVLRTRERAVRVGGLAQEFGVSEKTIRRDIELLRDLGAPLWFDYQQNHWCWNAALAVPWYFGGTIANPRMPKTLTDR
jgi:hypothetical protein